MQGEKSNFFLLKLPLLFEMLACIIYLKIKWEHYQYFYCTSMYHTSKWMPPAFLCKYRFVAGVTFILGGCSDTGKTQFGNRHRSNEANLFSRWIARMPKTQQFTLCGVSMCRHVWITLLIVLWFFLFCFVLFVSFGGENNFPVHIVWSMIPD